MLKRIVSLLIVISISVSLVPIFDKNASAAGTYNASAALAYAEAHWNDGVGLCAEFVSKCLNAGGCSSYSASCTALVGQLRNVSMCEEYRIPLNSNMSISMSQYLDKMSPGDPVFYHCSYQGNYQHVVLCNGTDSSGYMKAYSHNRANNGTSRYYYSSTCPECGRNSIDYATVFHFNSTPSCTTHTKGTFLWYEAAHPHYNYWTCAVCGDTFTDGTKATVSSCSECTISRDTRIDYWFSKEEMGEETLLIEPGEWMYLCYKLYDANTGDLYNSYSNANYTVTLTIYNRQTGEVEHTSQYNSDDNAWIAIRRGVEGIYDGEIVVSGHLIGTYTTAAAYYASTHTITYDANGGSGAPATQTRGIDGTTLSTTVPSRFGYNFAGWSTSATATTASYQPGDTFSGDIYDPETQSYNTVLYAVWEQAPTLSTTTADHLSPTISYPGVGFYYKFIPSVTTSYRIYGHGEIDNKVYLYDAAGNLLASDDDSGEGTQFQLNYVLNSGQTYYINVKFYNSSSTGILGFTIARGYTISYNANGGIGVPANSYKYHYIDQILSSVQPTRTGYTFVGWNTSSSGSGPSYQPGDTYTSNSNVTLYAQWVKGCANNTHTYTQTVTNPTCTAQGYTTHTCSVCGDSYKDTYTNALGHSYSYKVATKPTTSATGKLTGTCSRCSGTTTVTLPKLNTTDYTYSVVKAATCTATGTGRYTWKTTTYGSFYFDVTLEKISHSYKSTVTAPTCTAQGYTTHTCSVCGDSYKDTYTNALGHNESGWIVDANATCTASGSKHTECTRCGVRMQTAAIPATGHKESEWIIDSNAGCTYSGSKHTKCLTCGATLKTESIPSLGHNYSSTVIAPNCTEQGYTKHTCSRCGNSYTDSYVDPLGHNWNEGIVTIEPTEETEGEKLYTCTRCNGTRTEVLPILEHTHAYTGETVAPTCTEQGYTVYTCSCGDCYKDNYVDALGHIWDEGIVTIEPTEETAGERVYTCTRCNATRTEVLPILEHTHAYTGETVAPTCTEQGYTVYTCSCGDCYKDNYVDALGHIWDEGIVTIEPTEETPGEKVYTCTRCGERRTEAISTLPPEENHLCDGGASCPGYNFVDMPKPNNWAHAGIDFAIANGLFNGMTDTTFAPNSSMTRGMLVTVLWRYAEQPIEGTNSFTDVPNGKYYTKAVTWAAHNGIVSGIGNNRFDPNGNITREQMAAILYRYAGQLGIDTTTGGNLSSFSDSSSVSNYAVKAMKWAVAEGLINGADGKLMPKGNATRAQVATILMRFIENVVTT